MKIKALIIVFILISLQISFAQSYAFGVKGGLTAANQRFNSGGSYDNGLLFKYHGALYIENAPDDPTSVLFAQVGYHTRGHARRYRRGVSVNYQTNQLFEVPAFTEQFVFNNAALIVGVKRRGVLNSDRAYYAVGLRGEYTVKTNLADNTGNLPLLYSLYYPSKDFVKKINYGLTLSGGYEFPFSELFGGFVELNIHPDVSRQYYQPPITVNSVNPFTGEQIGTIPEQSIRNLTIEVTLGLRFLRKIIYTD
ncbi:MAG: hypothetical protein JNL70_09775 [Saprospiraceae bacterium]|nr:hypothetical protein [Saprospiraceae bacterium]